MGHDSIYLKNLNKEYKDSSPELILRMAIEEIFKNKIAYVCSFGTESAIILHMISQIDRNFPVILINTNFLFKETIEYKNYLIQKLKLKNCKEIFPNRHDLIKNDKNGNLWKSNPDSCCNVRKVLPLKKKLRNYQAWISGRKSYHKGEREFLKIFEFLNQKVVVNPLASVKKSFVDSYFDLHNINKHPLFTQGYLSIGCINCTIKPSNVNDPRSGRWTDNIKTECGIHYSYKK